jgi:diguanylate cyclase (GGDEF)-like protein
LALANRTDKELIVIYIDILDMGEINREYGRDVGDRVLHEVGETLRAKFRQDDIIGRIGNDNYVVLALIDPAVTEDLLIARIPRMIEISPGSDQGPPDAHLSMGLTRHNPAEELTLKELIDLAGQNLKAL